ncbi:hypothetical protein [Jiella marina]|uniref:hypothetical protein n=1 Tax=Jiella sp. LLJ827 TaxID=2917712 RepID=UPI002100735D|nr:hypothetical protein [Jiella sp. LLJ827]MCQ0986360.1 hypothetical protein [Jiella sp. LLJ827]
MIKRLLAKREEDVCCTVEVSNTFESLHAHLRFDGGVTVEPGDEVLVHGEPVKVPYGETAYLRRHATIVRAGWFERTWTRATGDFEFMELCEFSFSERATL